MSDEQAVAGLHVPHCNVMCCLDAHYFAAATDYRQPGHAHDSEQRPFCAECFPDGLRPLFDAALPEDAPGAWIREAILQLAGETPDR